MTPGETIIIAAKSAILLLGGAITYFALKAYYRTNEKAFRILGVGFAIITFGALLGGISHQILNVSLTTGLMIDSILTAFGFAVILLSLYMK